MYTEQKDCDNEYLAEELKNIEDIFMENGYSREEIREGIQQKQKRTDNNEEEKLNRGIVVLQNIPNFTPGFNKIARKHGFRIVNKTGSRVRDLTSKAKTPLGDKNADVVYHIPCKCRQYAYNGETHRKWCS